MTYLTSIRANPLRHSLPLALAVGAFALMSARVHAADTNQTNPVQLDPITVTAPAVKVVGRDYATNGAIDDVTVKALVQADPTALKTNYGALMLEYSVRDAARKACDQADPLSSDDGTCYRNAMASAEPQVEAAIARARS